jgi:hypothetical protein
LHCDEEICYFLLRQVGEARNAPSWRHENMAGEDGLEIDEGEREGGEMEDLPLFSQCGVWTRLLRLPVKH